MSLKVEFRSRCSICNEQTINNTGFEKICAWCNLEPVACSFCNMPCVEGERQCGCVMCNTCGAESCAGGKPCEHF